MIYHYKRIHDFLTLDELDLSGKVIGRYYANLQHVLAFREDRTILGQVINVLYVEINVAEIYVVLRRDIEKEGGGVMKMFVMFKSYFFGYPCRERDYYVYSSVT